MWRFQLVVDMMLTGRHTLLLTASYSSLIGRTTRKRKTRQNETGNEIFLVRVNGTVNFFISIFPLDHSCTTLDIPAVTIQRCCCPASENVPSVHSSNMNTSQEAYRDCPKGTAWFYPFGVILAFPFHSFLHISACDIVHLVRLDSFVRFCFTQ